MKKRTQNLVLRKFQLWFLMRVFFYAAAFSGLLFVGIAWWYRAIYSELLSIGGLLSSTYIEVLNQKAERGLWILAVLTLSLVGMTTYLGFLFSARIAGPVFALLRHLEKCAERGELSPLKLRHNDQFTEIAENFNRMVENISHESGSKSSKRRG